jgi:hypothetical protein
VPPVPPPAPPAPVAGGLVSTWILNLWFVLPAMQSHTCMRTPDAVLPPFSSRQRPLYMFRRV